MLSLTIEEFALYSVDGFGERNKGHHQKHNLHLVKRQMLVSLIILSKLILSKLILSHHSLVIYIYMHD